MIEFYSIGDLYEIEKESFSVLTQGLF